MPTFTYDGETVFTPAPEGLDIATQTELDAAIAVLTVALAGKQDSATAATDAEVAAAVATINSALGLKQDAATAATDAELSAHEAETTDVHGVADTSDLIVEGDSRLSDSRVPTGSAGGVLGGTFPSPSFAVDMATQAELDAVAAAKQSVSTNPTHTSGTLASRPSSSLIEGSTYYATDNGLLYVVVSSAWVTAKPGQELAYAERTTDFTTTSTSGAAVPELAFTIAKGVRPINLLLKGTISVNVTGKLALVSIFRGATQIGAQAVSTAAANQALALNPPCRDNAAAGTYAYSVVVVSLFGNGTTDTVKLSATATFQAIEV